MKTNTRPAKKSNVQSQSAIPNRADRAIAFAEYAYQCMALRHKELKLTRRFNRCEWKAELARAVVNYMEDFV